MGAERAAEQLLHRARGRDQAFADRRRWRPPSPRASRPGPRSRCCRSSPAAPGSRRARRTRDSNESIPCSSAASTLARPWPRVLWKWAVSSDPVEALARGGEELADLARVRHPGRVAEGDLLASRRGQALGDLEHAVDRHLALVGAAEAGRDHALAAQPLGDRARDHALEAGERLGDRAVDVLAVVGLRRGEEEVDLVEALAERERALEPALVRDQDRVGDPVEPLVRRRAPRSASASCGITSGRTNEVSSIRCSPAAPSIPISRTFSAVGITSGSFWKPSRGPTSRIRALLGNSLTAQRLCGGRPRREHRRRRVARERSGRG